MAVVKKEKHRWLHWHILKGQFVRFSGTKWPESKLQTIFLLGKKKPSADPHSGLVGVAFTNIYVLFSSENAATALKLKLKVVVSF